MSTHRIILARQIVNRLRTIDEQSRTLVAEKTQILEIVVAQAILGGAPEGRYSILEEGETIALVHQPPAEVKP